MPIMIKTNKRLVVGAVLLACLAAAVSLVPAGAQASKVVNSYCSPSGDFCQYILRSNGKIKLEMRQFPLRGNYKLCVKPPGRGYSCRVFRWKKSGPIFKSTVTFSRHFPSRKAGRYKVQWRTADGYKLGKSLSFRKG
jgi:hypothetical protein